MDLARPSPSKEISPSRGELEARVADLEGIIEALVASQSAAARPAPHSPPARVFDPVALTEALHPRGLKLPRKSKRARATSDRTLSMRVFVFNPDQ